MKKMLLSILSLIFFSSLSSTVFADARPSPHEMSKLKSALSSMGCKGGHMEKEKEGVYEVDDTTCHDGKYDIEFDANFTVMKKERD